MDQKKLFLTCILYIYSSGYAFPKIIDDESLEKEVNKIKQDSSIYVSKAKNLDYDINNVKKKFFLKYFLPWTNPNNIIEEIEIKNILINRNIKFKINPGFGPNRKKISIDRISSVIENINVNEYPNKKQFAITIKDTNIRKIPLDFPSYKNWDDIGNGYPFDRIQVAFINAFQPIYVLHQSKNKEWFLILDSHKNCGWIKSTDLAFVSDEFKQDWMNIKNYICCIRDEYTILDNKTNNFVTNSRIGQIFPFFKQENTEALVLYARSDVDGNAYVSIAKIQNSACSQFPLIGSEKKISELINNLLNQPYGWNGTYGLRDCASILKDLFIPFGILLPSKSKEQIKEGQLISLKDYSNEQKYAEIIKNSLPFLTLIRMPGHIFLYIGSKNKFPIVFHSFWGYKTVYKGKEGRAIIGRSVIMPFNLIEKNNENIMHEWIENITAIVRLDSIFN